jgi:asparagine synthase (glutamine-hydrolysing)
MGIREVGKSVFGHTRLSILDPAGGHQPMADGDCLISYNGEVYNHLRLRREHLGGACFEGHSDTETILRLYRRLGPRICGVLDGMFALAIHWDGELFLARDPLGIKPLYLADGDDALYFCSEIAPLARLGRPVREFPAGSWFHSRLGWGRFYDLQGQAGRFGGDEPAARQAIRDTLAEAVRKRLLADVPVGVSLSGGLDSSIVALLASDELPSLHSFVVGVEGAEDLEASRLVSGLLGTRHHERVYTREEALAAVPSVIRSLESFDPALVRSSIPNHFLAQLAVEEVKVMLTGEGADELYAGYDYMSQISGDRELQDELLLVTGALHNTNLQRADRLSMAQGLEARVPFLDVASVSLALSLPPGWKRHGARAPKQLLREAFRNRLPGRIVDRPKQKFSAGAGSSDLLRSLAETQVSNRDLATERARLRAAWGFVLPDKESLYCYRLLRDVLADEYIFPSMGSSRSL